MPILDPKSGRPADIDPWSIVPPDVVSEIVPAYFVVAVDLGSVSDSTAIVVLDVSTCSRSPRKPDRWEPRGLPVGEAVLEHHYTVRLLHRPRLGVTYPVIIDQVKAFLQELPPRPQQPITVFDATGLGTPVLQLARQQGIRTLGLSITAGNEAHRHGIEWTVPKALLVGELRLALHQNRLKIAHFPERDVLADELASFTAKVSASGRTSFEAAGSDHDDTVLSLAMAVYVAKHRPLPARIQRLGY